ncbi:ankyrin repeat and MYND domain-containing protein 2-like [Halichondria panicea]|uniref:ankyrin repeat and MYND domain-containing protein 2-like n=1 Tax=Halichondria panicea TaxID=6063 RepID=UPI00312B356E
MRIQKKILNLKSWRDMAGVKLLDICSSDKETFCLEDLRTSLSLCEQVDTPDKGGMTGLMHCAYRGHTGGVSLLLERGANVNSQQESDGYTPLMFATIAGQSEVVDQLLEAGATTTTLNKIGKTASQLGAFVGQHDCVQVINNYFPLSELQAYTSKAKLPLHLSHQLHKLLSTTHIHPVHLVQRFSPELCQSFTAVERVLENVCRERLTAENESLSLKAHYMSFLLRHTVQDGSPSLLKRLLTFSATGVPVELDRVLRQCLRDFPHIHSVLLKQLVSTLARVEPGGPPSALSLFTSVIVGEKTSVADGEREEKCATCGTISSGLKKCTQCKLVFYCGVACQRLAWTTGNHKKLCKKWTSANTNPSP